MKSNFLKKDRGRSAIPANVKRVLRQGSLFICGICRKTYESEVKAESCLESCGSSYSSRLTVVPLQEDGHTLYACGFCRRKYAVQAAAKECSRMCSTKVKSQIEQERKAKTELNDPQYIARGPQIEAEEQAIIDAQTRTAISKEDREKFEVRGRRLICRSCGKGFLGLIDVIECYDQDQRTQHSIVVKKQKDKKIKESQRLATKVQDTPTHDLEPISIGKSENRQRAESIFSCKRCNTVYESLDAANQCEQGSCGLAKEHDEFDLALEPELIVPVFRKKSAPAVAVADDDKFHRDGARYVCKKCSKRYFTRVEVIECFDGDGRS